MPLSTLFFRFRHFDGHFFHSLPLLYQIGYFLSTISTNLIRFFCACLTYDFTSSSCTIFNQDFLLVDIQQNLEKIFVELDEHFRHVAQKRPRVLYSVELHKIGRLFLTNPAEGGKCKSFPKVPKNFQPTRFSKNPQKSPAFSRARDFQELPARLAVCQGIGFLVETPIFQNSDKLGLYCQVLRSWPILRNSDKLAYIPELRQARSILPSLEM